MGSRLVSWHRLCGGKSKMNALVYGCSYGPKAKFLHNYIILFIKQCLNYGPCNNYSALAKFIKQNLSHRNTYINIGIYARSRTSPAHICVLQAHAHINSVNPLEIAV